MLVLIWVQTVCIDMKFSANDKSPLVRKELNIIIIIIVVIIVDQVTELYV